MPSGSYSGPSAISFPGFAVHKKIFPAPLRAIPVITADIGPLVEILGNTGLTFRTLDPVDLAGKIAKILDDPATSYELGRLARQRALDSYDKSRMIDAHARLYESVVANCG